MFKPANIIVGVAAALIISGDALAEAGAETDAKQLLPTWNRFVDELRDLGPKMLEKLPPDQRNDPHTQQEIGRLMLEALAASSLEAVAPNGDHPMFLPYINVVTNILQPNADTIYKRAVITPGGTYRLRGHRGSLRIARIGMFGPAATDGTIRALGYHDLNALRVNDDGNFDVLLSPAKPAGYSGDWWQLDPSATALLLRQMASDWSKERDPSISIERVDAPATRPRPDAESLERRLSQVAGVASGNALLLVDHVAQLRADGFVNKFKIWDVVANYGGLVGQFYYEAVYELDDDEALIMESDYPKTCNYASLILTNHIFETTDWYNNHSSLNDSQWRVSSDGKLRVVVSARDPGVHNWLDTAGYPMGVIQGRWTECSSTPMPSARKVPLSEVVKLLPPDTPTVTAAEREQVIRERRAQFQQRRLW